MYTVIDISFFKILKIDSSICTAVQEVVDASTLVLCLFTEAQKF